MRTILKMKCYYVCLFVLGLAMLITGTHAYAAKNIKIGVMGPMKFERGLHTWYGATLAAEEINAAGGIVIKGEPYKIELIKADSNEFQSIPDAINTMERLITVDKVDFIVGGSRTEAALAQQEVMADHKVIWGNGGGIAHPEATTRIAKNYDRYKYWFRVHSDSTDVGKSILGLVNMAASRVRTELGIKVPRVALLMEKTMWVDPIVKMSETSLPKMGMEIVGTWRPSSMATDISAELTAIKNAKAHIIFHIMSGPVGDVASRQWGELQIPAALIGFNTEAQRKNHWDVTGGYCNYESFFSFIGNDVAISEKTLPFFKKFLKRFEAWPEQNAATYDVIYVLKEAVEKAGTLKADAVIAEIEKVDISGAMSRRIAFEPKEAWKEAPRKAHQPRFAPGYQTFVGVQWRDGKLVTVWPDGNALLGDKSWEGFKYEGTKDYQLPPVMVEYWKKQK